MTVAVRFAPSPTGRLHVGNARVALFNWLFARGRGGTVLLRLDDTDTDRSTAAFAQAIVDDLAWLGLDHDRLARQSERLARYDAAAAALRSAGRLYPCYETAAELEQQRRLRLAQGRPPVYDRAALRLSDAERAACEAAGRRPHWRFRLASEPVTFDDLVRGSVTIDPATVSDPVLLREDGRPLYTFCSVVDDIDFAISHVIRGEDHVTNTAAQVALFRALDAPPPAFAHIPLLVGPDGGPLSKRLGGLRLAELRDDGIEPLAICSLLARLGTARPVEVRQTLAELMADFDFGQLGRAPARFDPAELAALSARLLHEMPYALAAPRLAAAGLGEADEAFWLAVRGNLGRFAEAAEWWQVVRGPVAPVIADRDFLQAAAARLPAGPYDGETWSTWTAALRAETGRQGRALFQPLRLALTGRERGPEMRNLLPLIGPSRTRARLMGETA